MQFVPNKIKSFCYVKEILPKRIIKSNCPFSEFFPGKKRKQCIFCNHTPYPYPVPDDKMPCPYFIRSN